MTETGEISGGGGAEDPCEKLRRKIDEYINRNKKELDNRGTHGLVHRFRELISSMSSNVLNKTVTDDVIAKWQTHIDEIERQQDNLKKLLDDLRKNGCGDPPSGAWSWAERPLPDPRAIAAEAGIPWNDVLAAGAGVGLVAAAGYGIYRFIRFLPSLYPPLWGTIPANLAIP